VIARRNPGQQTVERLDRVAGDDEVREHARRSLEETIAAIRRARDVKEPGHTGRRVLFALLGALAAVAGIVWMRRRRSATVADETAEDWFGESYRESSGPFEAAPPWRPPTAAPADPVPFAEPVSSTSSGEWGSTGASAGEWEARRGNEVFDSAGESVGRLQATYFDQDTGAPEWALVAFGALRPSLRFVPVRAARLEPDGVHLDVSGETMHSAPEIDADGHISQEEEDALYAHYGVERLGAVSFLRR
jgi:hypothetical protein